MLQNFQYKYLDDCEKMFYEIYKNENFNLKWLQPSKIKLYFNEIINYPNFLGYLYIIDEQLIGVCLGTKNVFLNYTILEIFVSPKYQNQDYGSKMLKDIETDLQKKGVTSISLSTLKNVPAYYFYKKNNYTTLTNKVNFIKNI